jgi:hypothetical protein
VAPSGKEDSQRDVEAKRSEGEVCGLDSFFLFASTSLCETACFLATFEAVPGWELPDPRSNQVKYERR